LDHERLDLRGKRDLAIGNGARSQLGAIPDGYRRFHVVAAIKLLYLALEHIAKKWTKPVKDGRPPCNASRSYSATVFRKESGSKPGRPGWGTDFNRQRIGRGGTRTRALAGVSTSSLVPRIRTETMLYSRVVFLHRRNPPRRARTQFSDR
jgi:hypothetical protein